MRVNGTGPSNTLWRAGRTLAVAVVFMAFASAGLTQSKPRHAELPNFHKVHDSLYRGGQPKEGGIRKLAALGIKTIINLRGEDDLTRAEESEAKSVGLSYFNISLSRWRRPSHEQISRVMAIIETQENWPVFIHCKRGSDRTGTIVALYRISHEGWTAQQAISEARRLGMSWIEFGMKDYISDYYRDRNMGKQASSEKAKRRQVN